MKTFFTPKEVSKIVGVSYRQIQYWDKTNFIKPSYRRRGKYRLYTFQDLIQMKLAKVLRGHQFSIQRLRKIIKSTRDLLPRVTQPMVDLSFLVDQERIMIFSGDVLMNEPSSSNYICFRVQDLHDEINHHYPELVDQIAAGRAGKHFDKQLIAEAQPLDTFDRKLNYIDAPKQRRHSGLEQYVPI